MSGAGRRAFTAWTATLEQALLDARAEAARARRLADLAIAALERALMLARVHQDSTAVTDAASEVADLFDAATR